MTDYEFKRKPRTVKKVEEDKLFDGSFYISKNEETDSNYVPDDLDPNVEYKSYGGHNYLNPQCFNTINGDLCFQKYARGFILHQTLRVTERLYKKETVEIFEFLEDGQVSVAENKLNKLFELLVEDENDLQNALRDLTNLLLKQTEIKCVLADIGRQIKAKRTKFGKAF